MAKRIVLFLLVNIFIIATLSTILSILGIQPYLTNQGIDYLSLLLFCLVWGFGGAFISLALSRTIAKWMMKVQIIPKNTQDKQLAKLYQLVELHAQKANLAHTPEVGVYDSAEMNAFATGPSKKRSLVAVSSGLLKKMDAQSISGVIAHEIGHIANGDMVTMTLLQGLINAFVMFLARIVAQIIASTLLKNQGRGASTVIYFLIVIVLEIVFMILGSIVIAWFSRQREYRADAEGARLAGKDAMIAALMSLKNEANRFDKAEQKSGVQYLMLSGKTSKFAKLFASHPPLTERIKRLEEK